LLAALAAGRPVGAAIEELAAADRNSIEELAAELPGWFQEWAEARMFTAVELPPL
jgi:hypothetical protein